jgi:hypothetical protein
MSSFATSVGATVRVLWAIGRTPSYSSGPRTAWLSAGYPRYLLAQAAPADQDAPQST